MNALVDYIKTHPKWRIELTQKPYCLSIKETGPYTIFSYSQIDSDFYNPVVRVSRGIILKIDDHFQKSDPSQTPKIDIVCWPFNKFGNYGEGYADTIDWASAKVQKKIDGSIIKVWYDDGLWHISTNGMIDAFEAKLRNPIPNCESFGDLFIIAVTNTCNSYEEFLSRLDRAYTYIFELTSPWNRIIVPYDDTTITHLGSRNRYTGLEENINLGVKKPKEYSFKTFDDVIANAAMLPYSQEGYVVVDKDWHRVKVKSKAYLQVHHLKSNGNINPKRILELIKMNEQGEFLSYFPEYKEYFDHVQDKYTRTLDAINTAITTAKMWKSCLSTKKDFAMKVLAEDNRVRKYMFAVWDGKDVEDMIKAITYEELF